MLTTLLTLQLILWLEVTLMVELADYPPTTMVELPLVMIVGLQTFIAAT